MDERISTIPPSARELDVTTATERVELAKGVHAEVEHGGQLAKLRVIEFGKVVQTMTVHKSVAGQALEDVKRAYTKSGSSGVRSALLVEAPQLCEREGWAEASREVLNLVPLLARRRLREIGFERVRPVPEPLSAVWLADYVARRASSPR